MKKLLVVLLAVLMAMSVVMLVACDKAVVKTGQYSYDAHGKTYGAKVDVDLTGEKITNIKLYSDEESGFVNLSGVYGDWTEEDRKVWTDGQNDFLLAFVGKTVADIDAMKATIKGVNGDANEATGAIAGATQSSARVILAVKNALGLGDNAPEAQPETFNGQYYYESAWVPGQFYGVKVAVTVLDNKITKVTTEADTDTFYNVSAGWADNANWIDGQADFLKEFEGKTLDEVKAMTANHNSGEENVTGVGDADKGVTGATQSAARVVLAVQDALFGTTHTGEYSYANAWVPEQSYGAKVTVKTQNDVIKSVTLDADTDTYYNVSAGWADKANWIDGQADFLKEFEGKTGMEVYAMTANPNKGAEEVTGIGDTDKGVTGATQSAARVVLAVKNAFGFVANAPVANTAYGIVHGGYVGIGTVTMAGKDVLTATLDEACLPTYVVVADGTADADKVEYKSSHGNKIVYKVVKFAGQTWTFDTEANDYKNADGDAMLATMKTDAALCETYAKAVIANQVAVVVGGQEDLTKLTADTLLKSNNGYWDPAIYTTMMGWAPNAEATCKYFVEYDLTATSFIKEDKMFEDNNGVSTGATWTDILDYINVLRKAAGATALTKPE